MSTWFRQVFGNSPQEGGQESSGNTSAFKDGIYTKRKDEEVPKRSLHEILLDAEPLIVQEKPQEDSSVDSVMNMQNVQSSRDSRTESYPAMGGLSDPSALGDRDRRVKKLAAAFEGSDPKPSVRFPTIDRYKSNKQSSDSSFSDILNEKVSEPEPLNQIKPAALQKPDTSETAYNLKQSSVEVKDPIAPIQPQQSAPPLEVVPSRLEPFHKALSSKSPFARPPSVKDLEQPPPAAVPQFGGPSAEATRIDIMPESSSLTLSTPYPTMAAAIGSSADQAARAQSEPEEVPLLGRASLPSQRPLLPVVSEHLKQWKRYVGWGEQLASESVLDDVRLASLDIFRGLVIAGFMVVVNSGSAFPFLNYSAWDGITVGDLVDPFLLFIVGVSVAVAFKRVPSKRMAFSKVLVRTLKIFLIGLFLQGGYFHGPVTLSYGVNLNQLRFSGTLQRLAVAFFVVSVSEIAVMKRYRDTPPQGYWQLVFRFMLHWGIALLLTLFHVIITFFLYVPDWDFPLPGLALQNGPGIAFVPPISANITTLHVRCGKYGDLSPACNAASFLDRSFLGLNHMDQSPAYQFSKLCTASAPLPGPLLPDAPSWCQAPFEAEGLLGVVGGTLTAFAGLHFGHVLTHFRQHWVRLSHCTIYSALLLSSGWLLRFPLKAELHRIFHDLPDWLILDFNGIPLNRQLYSLSFLLLTSGAGGLLLAFLYLLADVSKVRFYTKLLEWLGRNALLVYVLAVAGVLQAILVGFYMGTPENNIVVLLQGFISQLVKDTRYSNVLTSALSVVGWALAAGFLTGAGHSWKF